MEKDILLLVVGAVVGAMNAIAGGGMLIGFPVLVALGLPALIANATGSLVTTPGQITSAIGYRQYLRKVPPRFAWLLLPCLLGAVAGALTLRMTAAEHFAKLVPFLVFFGVFLFAFQPYLHMHMHRHIRGARRFTLPLWVIGLVLLPLCFYGSFFGPGYGFLMLAFLGFTNLPDTHMMNALKNISAVVVAGTTTVCVCSAHLIDWRSGLIMAAGCTIGGYFGARGAMRISSHWLRIAIICIGVTAVVYLGLHEY